VPTSLPPKSDQRRRPQAQQLLTRFRRKTSGQASATDVIITDSIVPGLTSVVVSNGGTYDPTTGIVTFPPLPSLASGADAAVLNTVSFVAPNSGSVSNTASSSSSTPDPTPENNTATVTTTLTPQADVVTTKTGPATATAGSTVTYTISTQNIGPSTATDVTITDSIVPGLTSVVVSNGGTYDPTTGIVTFPPLPSLASGADAAVLNTVSFVAPNSGSVSNTASSSSSTPDPTPGNNNGSDPTATVTTTITPQADVVTTKTGPATATAGSTVTYTISTQNIGPSTATDVTITDSIVPGLTSVVVSNGGTYDPTTGIVTFPPLPSLASGADAAVFNTVSFVAPNSGSVSNTARSSSSTPDLTPGNNNGSDPTATVTTSITPQADVVTTKTGPATATAGSTVTYTISTQNIGPSTATDVTITDSIVPGLTSVVVSNGGTYDPTTGIVTFPPLPSLASGADAAVLNTVSFVAPNSGSVSNTARSSSSTPDPTPGNNNGSEPTATVTTTLTTPPVPTPTPPVPLLHQDATSDTNSNEQRTASCQQC
jgi:uncharacterized repeat protein (TIGR01451 family)